MLFFRALIPLHFKRPISKKTKLALGLPENR